MTMWKRMWRHLNQFVFLVQNKCNPAREKQAKMAEEENPVKASFAKLQSTSGTCDYTPWKTFIDLKSHHKKKKKKVLWG